MNRRHQVRMDAQPSPRVPSPRAETRARLGPAPQPPALSKPQKAVQLGSVSVAPPSPLLPAPDTAPRRLFGMAPAAIALIAVAAGVLILLGIGLVASAKPAPEPEHVTSLALETGESRMVSISYSKEVAPVDFNAGDPAVVEVTIFHRQDDAREGAILHLLASAVAPGETRWSVRFDDGRLRTFDTRVSPAKTSATPGTREQALQKISEGDFLEKAQAEDPANLFRAKARYREACDILRAIPYGTEEAAYEEAHRKLEEVSLVWSERYLQVEGDLTAARVGNDAVGARKALKLLMEMAPDERTAEFQKNACLLNYIYVPKRKDPGSVEEE